MATFYKNGKRYMYCPQCGNEMEENARNCLHCGYINYDNKDNSFLKKFASKKSKTENKFNLKRNNNTSTEVVDPTVKTKLEKDYKAYTIIKNFIICLVLIVVCYFGYTYISSVQDKYVDDSKKIVDYVRNNLDICGEEYYFAFDESVLKERGLNSKSPYFDNEYFGYVLVQDNNYYIAISDGTFGIREVNIKDIKRLNVLPYFGSDIKEVSSTTC